MKPTFGSAYLDDNLTQFNKIHCILFMLSKEAMISKEVTIFSNTGASKNISGLVKVSVTSPAGLMKFFLNIEPCRRWSFLGTPVSSTTFNWLVTKIKIQIPNYFF